MKSGDDARPRSGFGNKLRDFPRFEGRVEMETLQFRTAGKMQYFDFIFALYTFGGHLR